MTDSRDRISGPTPEDTGDDPDSQTFFEDESAPHVSGSTDDTGRDGLGDGSAPNAGYTGGLAAGTQSGVGMRQIVADDAAAANQAADPGSPASGDPGNLAQDDQ